jgi:subtilisin family serine protease
MRWRWLWIPLFICGLCNSPAAADNRVIVRTTLGLQGLQAFCNGLPLLQNCTVVEGLDGPLNQLFLVTTPLDLTTFLNLLGSTVGIVDAEADQLLSLVGGLNQVTTPPAGLSDTTPVNYSGSTVWDGYVNQPAAQIVRVSEAQSTFQVTGRGIVADIDTGVDPNHPALQPVLLPGYDFTRDQPGGSEMTDFTGTPPSGSTTDIAQVNQSTAAVLDQSTAAVLDTNPQYSAFGHGTMVMGIIHLVAPHAQLLPLKAFSSDGTGFLSNILHAAYYAVQSGANVINMSFDMTSNSLEFSKAMDYANENRVICASSAGNDGMQEIVYPAAFQNDVMGVASTSDTDTRSSFSNYGDAIVWVAAPGEAIISTYPFSTYAAGWGTSFSAPFVSGAGALLLNVNPTTNESIAAAAVAHAVPLADAGMGNGRLDLVQALQSVTPPGN